MNSSQPKSAHSKRTLGSFIFHATFVLSAIALAWIDRLTFRPSVAAH